MNLKNAFYFIFSLLLMAGIAWAQQAAAAGSSTADARRAGRSPRGFLIVCWRRQFSGRLRGKRKQGKHGTLRNARRTRVMRHAGNQRQSGGKSWAEKR